MERKKDWGHDQKSWKDHKKRIVPPNEWEGDILFLVQITLLSVSALG